MKKPKELKFLPTHKKNKIPMDYLTYTEKLNYLLEMIEKGRMTSLQQAAEKFDCSQSTIKRMLSFLRGKGHKIIYYRMTKKFGLKKRNYFHEVKF